MPTLICTGQARGCAARLQQLQRYCTTGVAAVKWGMEVRTDATRMRRFSVQVPEDLWAGLNDLARRERQDLQPMLRDILQAVVDGDDPGRVVSAGTREAIDALRDEQRGGGAALAQVVREGLESLRNEQGRGEAARARVLKEVIESLQTELVRGRAADEAARADLRAALRELQAGVDQVLELQTPPAPDEAKRGRRSRLFGGGGER